MLVRGVRWLSRRSPAGRYAMPPSTEAPRVSHSPRTGLSALLVYGLVAASLFGLTAAESAGESAAHAALPAALGLAAQPSSAAVSSADLDRARAEMLTEAARSIDAFRTETALTARQKGLRSAAATVRAEVDRLRNLSTFAWPTAGGVASGFGWRRHPILGYRKLHSGADIGGVRAADLRRPVRRRDQAAASGYNGGSGINARINHGQIDGVTVETAYLHMSQLKLRGGQRSTRATSSGVLARRGCPPPATCTSRCTRTAPAVTRSNTSRSDSPDDSARRVARALGLCPAGIAPARCPSRPSGLVDPRRLPISSSDDDHEPRGCGASGGSVGARRGVVPQLE